MSKELISTNPAKGYEEVGRIAVSSPEEIKEAVEKAREALPAWRAKSPKERGSYFQKFLDLYTNRVEEVAEFLDRKGVLLHEVTHLQVKVSLNKVVLA